MLCYILSISRHLLSPPESIPQISHWTGSTIGPSETPQQQRRPVEAKTTLIPNIGFNPVQKLPVYEFLNKENKQWESITHKTHMHRDFPLDPKTRTTRLIFHYIPFNVTIHIYTCRSIQYHGLKNHRVQNHGPKTIGRFTQPNIGSKKNFPRVLPWNP